MQKEVIECNTEVAVETKRGIDFVEYIINKNSHELRDVFKVLKLHELYFQNNTLARKSRNALAFTARFPILKKTTYRYHQNRIY